MNINSIENAMLKIPSVTEVSIKTPPKIYEAFIYKWTNLMTNKKYVGSHKGKVGDGYKDTSSNIEFKAGSCVSKAKFNASSISSATSLCQISISEMETPCSIKRSA